MFKAHITRWQDAAQLQLLERVNARMYACAYSKAKRGRPINALLCALGITFSDAEADQTRAIAPQLKLSTRNINGDVMLAPERERNEAMEQLRNGMDFWQY